MKPSCRRDTATLQRARRVAREEAAKARAAKHQASYEYAERFCERMGRALQEVREGRNLTMYALAQEAGVAREMIDRVEQDDSRPTLFWLARVAFAMGLRLSELVARIEEEMGKDE